MRRLASGGVELSNDEATAAQRVLAELDHEFMEFVGMTPAEQRAALDLYQELTDAGIGTSEPYPNRQSDLERAA